MIKFVVLIRDNYNYSIIQLDLLQVVPAGVVNGNPGQPYFTLDRASYDAHASAMKAMKTNMGHHYYGSNRIYKVPCQYRGRHVVIDSKDVYDTRADASAAAMKLVEDKVRNDILKKKKMIVTLESEIAELSGRKLNPVAKFQNCSTLDMKKKKKNP